MQAIRALWSKLVVNDNPVTEYYIGSRTAVGQKDDQGTFTWEDGSKYDHVLSLSLIPYVLFFYRIYIYSIIAIRSSYFIQYTVYDIEATLYYFEYVSL